MIGSSRADFPSWPGAPKTLLTEAVDMFAVLTHSSPIWTSSSEEDFFEKGVD